MTAPGLQDYISQPSELAQFSLADAARHEKAPGVATGRFSEMEREKRLELIRFLLETLEQQLLYLT